MDPSSVNGVYQIRPVGFLPQFDVTCDFTHADKVITEVGHDHEAMQFFPSNSGPREMDLIYLSEYSGVSVFFLDSSIFPFL